MYNSLNPEVLKTVLKQLGDIIDYFNCNTSGQYFSEYQKDLEVTIYSKIWTEIEKAANPENTGKIWHPHFNNDSSTFHDYQLLKALLIEYRNRLQVTNPSTIGNFE